MIIAIDGYSSTGKSSISKLLASRLGFTHIDTGALYRGITLYALRHCLNENDGLDHAKLIASLQHIHLRLEQNNENTQLFLNDENVSDEIREPKVANFVSEVAAIPEVRTYLLDVQRSYAQNTSIVMDGRDIGTTIFPNADFKFFLTASVEERTRRRHLELISLGKTITEAEVRKNLTERDFIDENRSESPLRKADDAIVIDNSNINKEQTLELMLRYIENKISPSQ